PKLSITSFNVRTAFGSGNKETRQMLYSWASGKPLLGRLRRDSLRPQPDIPIAFQAPVEILPIPALDGPRTGTPAVAVSAQKRLSQIASLKEDSRRTFYCFSKRCIDVGLAGLALVLLLPLLLLIAVLIKLDSPGPVLFTHERVGAKRQRGSREAVWAVQQFGMHKFRSMFQNADSRVHEAYIRDFVEGRVRPNTESGGKFKLTNDPRVTRVGRFLRRTSLDELPQLFNVLKGQMSLVG